MTSLMIYIRPLIIDVLLLLLTAIMCFVFNMTCDLKLISKFMAPSECCHAFRPFCRGIPRSTEKLLQLKLII